MNTQIHEEASEWIVRHRSDSLDADSRRRFDAWLRESPQHVRAYLEMSSIWEEVPALEPSWNRSADELITRACADSNVFPLGEAPALQSGEAQTPGLSLVRTKPTLFFSLAASLLMAVGIAGWLYLQRDAYSTGIGEQRTIALPDGSSIELNARSKIQIHYTDHERAIDLLEGQAFFRVAKDANRPFIVESNGTQVRAVGTQFDVYRKSAGTVVTVVEGRVAVLASIPDAHVGMLNGTGSNSPEVSAPGTASAPGTRNGSLSPLRESEANEEMATPHSVSALEGEVLLSAGEQLLIARAARAVPKPANIEAATAWTQQRLIFDFAPLTEVAQEFNRYNRRPLIIDDPSLQGFHVSGSFSSTDPTLLLRFLREQPGIAVNETAREIHISRQGTGAE